MNPKIRKNSRDIINLIGLNVTEKDSLEKCIMKQDLRKGIDN